jgi:hypothetical protein
MRTGMRRSRDCRSRSTGTRRNSRLRNTVTRRGKKAAKEGSVTISLVTERGDALEAAIRDYQRVYFLQLEECGTLP